MLQVAWLWSLLFIPSFRTQLRSQSWQFNVNTSSKGIMGRNIMDIITQLTHKYHPIDCCEFILDLRKHGSSYWQVFDLDTIMPIPFIITSTLEMLQQETQIETVETQTMPQPENEALYAQYFDLLRKWKGNNVIDEHFGIDTCTYYQCTKCWQKWHILTIEHMINIPMHGKHIRWWIESDVEQELIAEWMFVHPNILGNLTIKEMIEMIILKMETEEVEETEDSKSDSDNGKDTQMKTNFIVEVREPHFVYVNNTRKYIVYGQLLSETPNGFFWQKICWSNVAPNAEEYCHQFKNTLTICKVPINKINEKFNFTNENYQITTQNTIMPKSYVLVHWTPKGTQKITTNTYKINKLTDEVIVDSAPPGDENISLNEHMKEIFTHGYLTKSTCNKCQSVQSIIIKPKIYCISQNCILFVNQAQAQYYEINWPFTQYQMDLPINDQKTQTMSIHGYIAEHTYTQYSSHWTHSENQTTTKYKMFNEIVVESTPEIEREDAPLVCVLILCNTLP